MAIPWSSLGRNVGVDSRRRLIGVDDRQAIVGRESELARLRRAVGEVRASGRGCLLLVTGEPGIGKSRLVGSLADEVLERGVPVAWGACRETEGAPPYWPWTQVLRAILPTNTPDDTAPDPVLTPLLHPGMTSAQPDRFLLFDAVSRTLAERSRRSGLVVVLDDLHRADDASLALLRFLTTSLHAVPLLLVGTYRDTELPADGALHRLVIDLAGGDVELVELHGLGTAETIDAGHPRGRDAAPR